MAISVPVPKEITEYKEKIMFGMSGRQIIFSAIAVVLAVGIGVICYLMGMDISLIGYIIILATAPLMAMGFIRKNNMPFEKYLFLVLRSKMGQNLLTYKTELLIDMLSTSDNKSIPAERKMKHGSIQKAANGHEKSGRSVGECHQYAEATQGGKGKRKVALRKIKAARQEYRTAKRRATTEATGRSSP